MARRRESTSVQFDVGGAFNDQLVKDIVEAVMPKETRKQAQKQLALEVLARISPRIAEFAPEEKEKFYNQYFFPAYGTYQPPIFRKMFGAKPETILPLPKGAEEIPVELEGAKIVTPMGRRKELKAGLTLPKQEPMKFLSPPLLQPEHEAELETQAKVLYPESPEEQADWLKTQKTALMTKVKPTKEDILWETITKAERMVDKYKEANPGATEEEAITALPPNLRRRYKEHLETGETAQLYKGALTEDIKARKIEREERMGLLKGREQRLAQKQSWEQDFQERKLKLQDLWKKLAARGKTPNQVYRDALTAYTQYSKNLQAEEKAHNQMEMGFSKLDPNYLPARFSGSRLSFEDWLRSEGVMFYERILDLESQGEEGKKGISSAPPSLPPKRQQPKGAFESLQEDYLQ